MNLKKNYDFKENLVLFVFWPVFGLSKAYSNIENKGARLIVILFSMLFGYSFIVPDEFADANSYIEMFQQMHKRDFGDFINYIMAIFVKETEGNDDAADLFLPTLYFILSRFTDNKDFLFVVFSLIFSTYIVLIFKFLINIFNEFPNINSRIYLFYVALLIPIFDINHFRWYVAFMTFILGMFGLLIKGERKYLFICIFSGLIHFSFFIFIALILLFHYLPKNKKVYYSILIASFIIEGVLSQYINAYGDSLSGSVQQRALTYSDDYYKDLIKEETETGLFILLQYQKICKYILLFVLIFLDYKKYINTEKLNNIFLFSIFVLSITNLGSDIHSFNSRFLLLYQVAACLTLIQLFSYYKMKRTHFTTLLGFGALMTLAIVQVRYGIPYMSVNLFLPFVGTPLFIENNISILNLIK